MKSALDMEGVSNCIWFRGARPRLFTVRVAPGGHFWYKRRSMSCKTRVCLLIVLAGFLACFAGATPPVPEPAPEPEPAMTLVQAAVLGVVEGVTEYLPISSTGHLLLTERLMGIPAGEESNAFAVVIQLGAILAVLGLYRNRVAEMFQGLAGRSIPGRNLVIHIGVAFIPAAVVGLLFDDWIESVLWGMVPVTVAWGVGGVAILAVSRSRRGRTGPAGFTLEELTWRAAMIIGLAQCLAMWPGVSRSLVTIVGGVLVGLQLGAAVEFSFLLGVVTLGAATAYKGLQFGPEMLHLYGPGPLVVGFVAATLSAILAVKWMVHYLRRHGLALFGTYRIILALVAAILLATGRI